MFPTFPESPDSWLCGDNPGSFILRKISFLTFSQKNVSNILFRGKFCHQIFGTPIGSHYLWRTWQSTNRNSMNNGSLWNGPLSLLIYREPALTARYMHVDFGNNLSHKLSIWFCWSIYFHLTQKTWTNRTEFSWADSSKHRNGYGGNVSMEIEIFREQYNVVSTSFHRVTMRSTTTFQYFTLMLITWQIVSVGSFGTIRWSLSNRLRKSFICSTLLNIVTIPCHLMVWASDFVLLQWTEVYSPTIYEGIKI